ncbi:MAG: hypothetical protein C4576_20330 [Desulfobacteraceae bacterium]|nr:MAG: hypothetical protein C4576_20330 [Desulfobacteraceae bacterium]
MKQTIEIIANSPKALLTVALFAIGLYWLPYLCFWKHSHLLIPDNLDANFVWYKVLLESGRVFSSNETIIEPFMGGLPRSSFPAEFSFTTLWLWMLGPFGAYILERALFPVVAFFGMFLLLRRYFVPREDALIQIGVALTFALLPFRPFGALSIPGLPFLLYAFLNLRLGDTGISNWTIIALYPFYSWFVSTGVFIIGILVLLFLYDLYKTRSTKWHFIFGLTLLCILFLFTNYRLVDIYLFDGTYVSHRSEFSVFEAHGPKSCLRIFANVLLFGVGYAPTRQTFLVFPIFMGLILLLNARQKVKAKPYMLILFFLIATSFLFGFMFWRGFTSITQSLFSFLPMQLQRFQTLHPLFWSILFALSLTSISTHLRIGRKLVSVFIGLQVVYLFSFQEILWNWRTPSYQEYFAEELFAEVKNYINQPVKDFRVVSVGIHPSVAQYNGFYTLDGYSADYPLQYKHKFRRIIAPELNKNVYLRRYFDNWGSRAYVLVGQDIGFMNRKGSGIAIEKLDLDLEAFKSMGGEYILSAVEISPTRNPQYRLLRVFKNDKSAWDIYLYQVT